MSEKKQSSMGNGNLLIRPNGMRIIRQYVELEWHDMSDRARVVNRYHGRWGGAMCACEGSGWRVYRNRTMTDKHFVDCSPCVKSWRILLTPNVRQ